MHPTILRTMLALILGLVTWLGAPLAPEASVPGADCGFDPSRPSLCRFDLSPGITLHADSGQVVEYPDGSGFDLVGDLELPTAGEPLVLAEARAGFLHGADGPVFVHGTALMPFPTEGFLAHIDVSRQPMLSFGVNSGAELGFLGAPLRDERHYLYFHGNSILEAGFGPISLTTPGAELTAVIDPLDPFIYIGGELVGLGDDGKKDGEGDASGEGGADAAASQDGGTPASGEPAAPSEPSETSEDDDGSIAKTGFGFSLSGLIPFEPLVDYGLEGRMPSFDGNVYVSGPVSLAEFLSLNGETVFAIDPDQDGDHPFEPTWYEGNSAPDIAIGGNGVLSVGVPFLKFLELGFDVGQATAVGIVSDVEESQVSFSGVLGIDQEEAFAGLPFPLDLSEVLRVYGIYGESELGSFIHAEGPLALDPSPVGRMFGLELGPIATAGAQLDVSSMGLTIAGTTGSSPIPELVFAEAGVSVHVAPNGLSSVLELSGSFRLDTFDLEQARFWVSPEDGVGIAGDLVVENTVFGMTGQFGASGYALTGAAELANAIEVNATEALQVANALLQNQHSRAALEDTLADAQAILADAQAAASWANTALATAQAEVDKIQKDIDYHVYWRTRNYNSYGAWKKKSCAWYDAPCIATRAANISYYWGRYTYHRGMVSTLSAARTAATGVLGTAASVADAARTAAAGALAGVEALQANLAALTAAGAELEARLAAMPDVTGDLRPIVSVTIEDGKLTGTVRGEWNGMQLTEGRVRFEHPAEACLDVPGVGELCSPL